MKDEIVGTRIGIYDVISESDHRMKDGHKLYHVKCTKCGWETDMRKIKIQRTEICTHVSADGSYKTYGSFTWVNKRLGNILHGMKQRCYNQNNENYYLYGGKGIKVYDEWLNNPTSFEEWAINNGYEDGLTINRKDENKDYCPDNCEWVTLSHNAKYKSTTHLIEIDGEIHTGRDWSKKLGFGPNLVNTYIRKYGEENTKEFIRRYLKNPKSRTNCKQSYYDLYMNE